MKASLMSSHSQYSQRFKRVLKYIDDHLDDEINLAILAEIADFSKFHFQRQFSACFGVSASQYIVQLRLDRSAHLLAFYDDSICDIAFHTHFQSQEAFSRAFKKRFGKTPLKFRRLTPWESWHCCSQIIKNKDYFMRTNASNINVNIINFPATKIASLSHIGNPKLVMRTVSKFIEWRKEQGNLSPDVSDTFNILHHDPALVPIDAYRFDVACSIVDTIADNAYGIVNGVLESCRCAVIYCVGSNDDMSQAINFLYSDWLPSSNEECSDIPLFVKRIAMYPNVAMHEQIFEIHLPLKSNEK